MKNYLIILVFLAPYLLNAKPQEDPSRLKLLWDPWPPYSYMGKNGRPAGLEVEILRPVLNKLQVGLELKKMPWKRGFVEIKRGRLDVAAGCVYKRSRAAYSYYSLPYAVAKVRVWVRKDSVSAYPLRKLGDAVRFKMRLGVSRGWSYGSAFEREKRNPAFRALIQEVLSLEQNIEKLRKGRIDGIFVNEYVAAYHFARPNYKGLFRPVPGFVLSKQKAYFCFSRKSIHKNFVDKFNKALRKFLKTHQYRALVKRFARGY